MKRLLIVIIKFYQQRISPMFPAACRYQPTCSHYMVDAIGRFGALKGSVMGIGRIVRCNPFVKGGYDPVPTHFTLKRNVDAAKEYRNTENKNS